MPVLLQWSEEAHQKMNHMINRLHALEALIPPNSPSTVAQEKYMAERLQALGSERAQLEIMIERMQVDSVKHTYEDTLTDQECPLCVRPMEDVKRRYRFKCCGQFICRNCGIDWKHHTASTQEKCPLCHSRIPQDWQVVRLEKRAQKGCQWAQNALADVCEKGLGGIKVNEELALQWHRRAAEQGCSSSMLQLGMLLRQRDLPESRRWLEATVEKGFKADAIGAMEILAVMNWEGWGGAQDKVEAGRLFTLLHAYSKGSWRTQLHLGLMHMLGNAGTEKNLFVARYYLEKVAALDNAEAAAAGQYFLAGTLSELYGIIYRGRNEVPGHSCHPICMSLLRKSIKNGYSDATQALEQFEAKLKSHCANCCKPATDFSNKLFKCSRCMAAWYCGRDCQKKHWKRGHNIDCRRCELG